MFSFNKNILDSKKRIRQKVSQQCFSEKLRIQRSQKLCTKIQRTFFFKDAQAVGFYAGMRDEIDVFLSAQKALQSGKKVFFPRMTRKEIEFREVNDLQKDLKLGKFGILEPVLKRTKKRVRSLNLVLIPGRAFDKNGGRLGRGLGCYDRFLKKWPKAVRMGVAFREQLVTKVPQDEHDVRMDVVIVA